MSKDKLSVRVYNIEQIKPVQAFVRGRDVVLFEPGDLVPADIRIIESESLRASESALTGESLPVKKHTGDTVYAGSFVTSGSGTAKVIKVAEANWAISLQSQAKKFQKTRSELLHSLNKIIKVISFLIVPVATCLIVIGIINSGSTDPWEMFKDRAKVWMENLSTSST